LFTLFAAACLLTCKQCFAQSSIHQSVDSLFLNCDGATPGYAIGIVNNGKVDYLKGYGMANLEYNIPITPSTPFHLASVSKQFTAFCIHLLAEQKKLILTDTIQKYLRGLPHYQDPLTILNLLQQTSGIRDQWELLGLGGTSEPDLITEENVLNVIYRQKELNFKPGDKWLYSNSNYSLLAQVIEKISGKIFADFIADNVFIPLQMTSSFINTDAKRIIPSKAYSYETKGDNHQFGKLELNYSSYGATDMYSSVEDLVKWLLNFDQPKVGNQTVFDKMKERAVLNNGDTAFYGSGLFVGKYKGLVRIFHDGNDAGYQTYIAYFPEKKFGVVVLSNLYSAIPAQLAMQIANLYLQFPINQIGNQTIKPHYDFIKTNLSHYQYTGNYETPGGNLIKITKGDSSLQIQFPDMNEPQQLKEINDTAFIVFDNYRIEFSQKDKQQFRQIKLKAPSFSNTADRVEYPNYTLSQLKEFTGLYYSGEIQTVYEVAIKNGNLVLHHLRNGEITLTSKTKDRFSAAKWYLNKVVFERNKNGGINSFRVSCGRTYNVLLKKIRFE
jgi:CubicO group peptidase (beta-lactamase class C family)